MLAFYTAASKLADGESGGKPRAVQRISRLARLNCVKQVFSAGRFLFRNGLRTLTDPHRGLCGPLLRITFR